jgi:2-polyprenyl-6-methoxyphenol hydroxylase-like FAD-dependent oxidoreductase
MAAQAETDVLVVGGGPVGLTLACELARHGARARIVDKNAAPQPWSKAAGVSSRTMEVLERMGIVDRALAKGRPMYGARIRNGLEVVASVDFRSAAAPTRYPYLFGLAQRDMELMLAERLAELGIPFERKTELLSFEQDDGGVTSTLRHEDGREEQVRSRFLVGADGAHSTVRKLLDLPFEGGTFEQTLMQADIRAKFPFEPDPNEAVGFISQDGPIGFLPLLADGRYRLIIINVENPPPEPPMSLLEEHVARRTPGVKISDPVWTVSFRFHGRIVPRYREGRVFLAGDAGHIHSPVGAQGMNLGMQDAFNLAWKLALVTRGAGRAEILESYSAERRPIGQGIVQTTDAATKRLMRVMTIRSALVKAVRDQVVGFVASTDLFRDTAFRAISGVDVAYPGSPIVGEHHSSIWTSEVGPGRPDERPGLRDWMRFSKGPAPGERLADIELAGEGETLFSLLHPTKHTLFLFDGAAATSAGYANLTTIAERVRRRYADVVETHVVVPRADRPKELAWDGSVIPDADETLHEHFCCASEGLYLVRPDGYVGFRAQPADEPTLLRYLETIFTA